MNPFKRRSPNKTNDFKLAGATRKMNILRQPKKSVPTFTPDKKSFFNSGFI
ncbi:hypothetical protein K4F_00760 [Enterococcus hirae]|jgi:hypothetical protein|nr:hypothetical protein K4F_00760 [Enterococcus hirae]